MINQIENDWCKYAAAGCVVDNEHYQKINPKLLAFGASIFLTFQKKRKKRAQNTSPVDQKNDVEGGGDCVGREGDIAIASGTNNNNNNANTNIDISLFLNLIEDHQHLTFDDMTGMLQHECMHKINALFDHVNDLKKELAEIKVCSYTIYANNSINMFEYIIDC